MTLDEVVKELIAYQDNNQHSIGTSDVFMSGKISGIEKALRLLAKVEHEPPKQTELERRAWEIYLHYQHGNSVDSFRWAKEWMDERDKRRGKVPHIENGELVVECPECGIQCVVGKTIDEANE